MRNIDIKKSFCLFLTTIIASIAITNTSLPIVYAEENESGGSETQNNTNGEESDEMTDEEKIEYLRENQGAMGYIDKNDLPGHETEMDSVAEAEDALGITTWAEPDSSGNYNTGNCLTRENGVFWGPSGRETYYNLDMTGVVNRLHALGYKGEYWVRDDGVKMFGDYVLIAADFNTRPIGTLLQTSRGLGIVSDTGDFVKRWPNGIDIAVDWEN